MTEEFELDDYIIEIPERGNSFFAVRDIFIKEFIKLIEEAVLSKGRRALVDIRKLAGNKLIEGEKWN